MNLILWIVQAILSVHTAIGALWKVRSRPESIPALSAISTTLWRVLIPLELAAAAGLVAPALLSGTERLPIVAAIFVAIEMAGFILLARRSGKESNQIGYWAGVAVVALFVAFARTVVIPH